MSRPRVKLSVHCGVGDWGCGALLGTYFDSIEEKYQPYCNECDWYCCSHDAGKYPFSVYAEIVEDEDDRDQNL